MQKKTSVSPDGLEYQIPNSDELSTDYERVKSLVDEARSRGDEVVVVMGMGFVGIVMAAIVADAPGKICDRMSKAICKELLEGTCIE